MRDLVEAIQASPMARKTTLCIASGPGLKAGTKLGKIRAIDVAPTVACILSIELPTAEGKPLEKLLARRNSVSASPCRFWHGLQSADCVVLERL